MKIGSYYYLDGMKPEMWDMSHETYGQPDKLVGLYLGFLQGTRRWHLFEVRTKLGDEGVLLMNDNDLSKLQVTEVVE